MTHQQILEQVRVLMPTPPETEGQEPLPEISDNVILFKIAFVEQDLLNRTNLRRIPQTLVVTWIALVLETIEIMMRTSEDTVDSISEAGRSVSFGSGVPSAQEVEEYNIRQKSHQEAIFRHRVPYR